MNILLITVGEPPLIFQEQRFHRTGILALELSKNNKVEYWSSNFFHQTKTFFNAGNYKINKNLNFKAIKTIGYKKNISLQRFFDQFYFALKVFYLLLKEIKKPNVIVTSLPTCDLSFVTAIYCKLYKVKFIIDVRDMWPDIFWLRKKNKVISIMIKILSSHQIFFKNFSISNADGVVSITEEFLNWSIKKKVKSFVKLNDYFYLSPPYINLNQNFSKTIDKINILFIGVISYQKFDFDSLFSILKNINDNIFFHFVGDGDDFEKLKSDSFRYQNIRVYGYQSYTKILEIAKFCQFGLANYNPTIDFRMSIPNKVIEYLSYNLNIIYCLEGSTKKFLNKNSIGMYYEYKDQKSLLNILNNLKINQKTNNKYRLIYEKEFDPIKVYSSYANFIGKFL